ncbi:MAG: DNA alkylation repair protein [Alphaproteobacteria bacterium]|nr:DNA alkylation repair protein [Alphaproteobacteria bacterium]
MSNDRIALPASGKMKDFFDKSAVEDIAARLSNTWPEFPKPAFLRAVLPELDALEYAARLRLISNRIASALPDDFPTALSILRAALGPEPETEFGEFRHLPFLEVVALRGLDHRALSVTALLDMTRWFSAEFSIRPFLDRWPVETLAQLHAAKDHPSPKVRRLLSEGTRPKLPWGMRLKGFVADPTPLLPILADLRNDPDAAVRRSVANSLNDIAKDHAALVIETLSAWRRAGTSEDLERLIRHALRHLVKAGDPDALRLLGFKPDAKLRIERFALDQDSVAIGGALSFAFTILSEDPEPVSLAIDYAVHFRKANGKTAPKVFKLAVADLAPGQSRSFEKRQNFKPVTTRVLYPGRHAIEILANGASLATAEFELTEIE